MMCATCGLKENNEKFGAYCSKSCREKALKKLERQKKRNKKNNLKSELRKFEQWRTSGSRTY